MGKRAFEQYRWQLLAILLGRWQPRRSDHRLRTVVRFSLRVDGQVAFAEVCRPSGDPRHDQEALDAVKGVEKFPPLPAEVGQASVFAFNFDSDFADPLGAGVPRKPNVPVRETENALDEPAET